MMDTQTLRQIVWQPKETAKLDFKIELYKINELRPTIQSEIQKWTEAKEQHWGELIKDVLALTNGNIKTSLDTGYLIIGADDKLKADGTPTLRNFVDKKLTPKEILEKVNSYCYPPLPDIKCEIIEVDSINLFVISIPPSPYLHRLSKQLKTPKKEYSPHTVLVRRGDGERTYEASPEEQKAIEQEKQLTFLKPTLEDSSKCFEQELENIDTQIAQDILKYPYWRINLYPQTYNASLLPSRNQCSELIDKNTIPISSNSYSYPRRFGDPIKGSNWTGIHAKHPRYEYWRFYQSGQFINFTNFWQSSNNPNYITDGEILYTVLTVFQFAANICQQDIYNGHINVSIEINNIKDFGLKTKFDLNNFSSQNHKATENSYIKVWHVQSNSLTNSSFDHQVFESIEWFVECFSSMPLICFESFKEKKKELFGKY